MVVEITPGPSTGGGGGVPTTRAINTTAPLTGGGDLSADLTLALTTPLDVADGGTGTGTTLTQGSVVLAGASGIYTEDNANFFWDETDHRLGIGTNAPSQSLVLQLKNSGGVDSIYIDADTPASWGNSGFGFQYFSNNQLNFGIFAGAYINFKGGGSQAALNGNWTFPSGGNYPPDVYLSSNSNSTDDVRLVVNKSGDGASQGIYMFTQRRSANGGQPELQIQATTIKFFARPDGTWNHNIFTGFAIQTLIMDATGFWTFQAASASTLVAAFQGAASQTANLTEWQDNSAVPLAAVTSNGGFQPAQMADTDAANSTLYYSTTASKLVYKDSGGVVNNLY